MKSASLAACSLLVFFLMVIPACQKERELFQDQFSRHKNKPDKKNSCQLISHTGLDDGYSETFTYNKQGLVETWTESFPVFGTTVSKFEYEKNDRLSRFTSYSDDVLSYTVVPVYKGNRIVRELWYQGDTDILDDELVNTYNNKGDLIKRESLNYGYYVVFYYDESGNVTRQETVSTDAATSGQILEIVTFEYEAGVLDPKYDLPGLPYDIRYTNVINSPERFTSLKQEYPIEDGSYFTAYEIDPSQSTLVAGPGNYVVFHNTFDLVSGVSNRQVFEYQNCDSKPGSKLMFEVPSAKGVTSAPVYKGVLSKNALVRSRRIIQQLKHK